MVSQEEAFLSSTLTSGIVTTAHGTAHYLAGGGMELQDPVVTIAGATVFGTTWVLSYLGMRGKLPF